MGYQVACSCGQVHAVPEGMAGSSVPCRCGRWLRVPLLSRLQSEAVTAAVPGVVFQYRMEADGSESLPFVSSGARELFGADAAELRGQPALAWGFTVPEDLEELQQRIGASWRDVTPIVHEWRVRTRGGQLKWLSGRAP